MGESGRRSVLGRADAELFADALTKLLVDCGDVGFAIEFDETVFLGHDFEFALDHGLVTNEGPIEVVREGHIAAGFPIADGFGFFELARESSFRANVEPKGEMRAKSHGVETGEVIAIDAANDAASDEGKDEPIGEDDGPGAESGNDAVLQLIEEVGGVHEGEGETGDGIFGEELVDVAADEVGTAQAGGLHGETFGFEPFLEESDLGGTARTVHALDDDEGAVQFARIETDESFAEEGLRVFGVSSGRFGGRRSFDNGDAGFVFFVFSHGYSDSCARGAKRLRSILEATISRICFWSLLTGRVPSRTTKLSVSTILSYSLRMRA